MTVDLRHDTSGGHVSRGRHEELSAQLLKAAAAAVRGECARMGFVLIDVCDGRTPARKGLALVARHVGVLRALRAVPAVRAAAAHGEADDWLAAERHAQGKMQDLERQGPSSPFAVS